MVIYSFAMSLDGLIARPNGTVDWLADHPPDSDYDFDTFLAGITGIVMGRGSYEVARAEEWHYGRWPVAVATTRPLADAPPGVQAVAGEPHEVLAHLRARGAGGAIWLFGGGVLARQFLRAGLVDVIEIGVIPVILGEGIPAFGAGPGDAWLDLEFARPLKTGAVHVRYRRRG